MSGRSSAYGDTTVEGHPAGPGSVSSSTGAISTTTAQHEGDGSEGEGETEGDIHTSNRSVYRMEYLSPTINKNKMRLLLGIFRKKISLTAL